MNKELLKINVNEFTEKKNGLTYLSWANAWKVAIENDANVEWSVDMYDGKPYLFDENLGYMVSTKVTIGEKTLPMQLPVMDNTNQAMRHIAYEVTTGKGSRTIKPATMFDINTAIMRCLVKNLAMFGLGLYIYAGEDLPDGEEVPKKPLATNEEDFI